LHFQQEGCLFAQLVHNRHVVSLGQSFQQVEVVFRSPFDC
jgi:hypothetical protein